MITSWPKRVKVVPVSTTTSPVTQIAEVAVKTASRIAKPCPLVVASGKLRSNAPHRISAAKPRTNTRGGVFITENILCCLEPATESLSFITSFI